MQSILRSHYALYGCNSVRLGPLTAQCSLAFSALQACTPRIRHLSSQHRSLYRPDSASPVEGGTLPKNQLDGRKRLSAFWTPTGGIEVAADAKVDSHSLLIRGGFLRQAHAGLFQLLPLGLRVQEKLEKLLDKHMVELGASKVSLSTLSSRDLWKKTGRMHNGSGGSPEIFQIQDRKDAHFILSPTHEEEVTSLVASIVKSYRDLPLRLYQITRKYRDEARPRQGLLRTREFLMKDLYTFDISPKSALETYEIVRKAYTTFFNEFKMPYLVAKAASGEMGGDMSHEFHFPSSKGEDNVVSCSNCGFVVNEELADPRTPSGFVSGPDAKAHDLKMLLEFASSPHIVESADGLYRQWFGYSKDGKTLLQAIYPTRKALSLAQVDTCEESQINTKAVQQAFPDLDLSVAVSGRPLEDAKEVFRLYDATIVPPSEILSEAESSEVFWGGANDRKAVYLLKDPFISHASIRLPILEACRDKVNARSLLKIQNGDKCSRCESGQLKIQSAVELGHTFYLGTRYSKPLNATVAVDLGQKGSPTADDIVCEDNSNQVLLQMGCHGIGVSRLIAAVADALVDSRGLNWPRVMAPFEAIVVPARSADVDAQMAVYDALARPQGSSQGSVDVILDDRQRDFGWKLTDADMIGYPVIVVIGRGWKERKCEVQCRRLGVKQDIPLQELRGFVEGLLDKI